MKTSFDERIKPEYGDGFNDLFKPSFFSTHGAFALALCANKRLRAFVCRDGELSRLPIRLWLYHMADSRPGKAHPAIQELFLHFLGDNRFIPMVIDTLLAHFPWGWRGTLTARRFLAKAEFEA